MSEVISINIYSSMKNKFNVLIKNKISVAVAQNVQCSMFNVVVVGFWVFFFDPV